MLFSQQGPIGCPQLDFPVASTVRTDSIAAECPIPAALIRANAKPHDLMHTFVAVPAMLHGRIHVRLKSRVEVVCPWLEISAY